MDPLEDNYRNANDEALSMALRLARSGHTTLACDFWEALDTRLRAGAALPSAWARSPDPEADT